MDKQKKSSIITLAALALLGTGYHFLWDGKPVSEPEGSGAPVSTLISKTEIPYRPDDNEDNVIGHLGYTLSYNSDFRVPNWVAWELLASEAKAEYRSREDKFIPDPLIRGRQAYDRDYAGSGYDRGHMAPAGDMKWSSQAMKECFYLSNVCPQDHDLNTGAWNDLEQQSRYEAGYYGKIWIVCGPVFEGSDPKRVGSNDVAVPDAFFKALLARRKDGSYAAIGFIFPNGPCTRNLTLYAMTVDELEKKAGMDLFFNLDAVEQEKAESEFDPYGDWRIINHTITSESWKKH